MPTGRQGSRCSGPDSWPRVEGSDQAVKVRSRGGGSGEKIRPFEVSILPGELAGVKAIFGLRLESNLAGSNLGEKRNGHVAGESV